LQLKRWCTTPGVEQVPDRQSPFDPLRA
jgi:hypothetical protein